MIGSEHYREAEKLIVAAAGLNGESPELGREYLAAAQVHAMLAAAAPPELEARDRRIAELEADRAPHVRKAARRLANTWEQSLGTAEALRSMGYGPLADQLDALVVAHREHDSYRGEQ